LFCKNNKTRDLQAGVSWEDDKRVCGVGDECALGEK
jgi:hypothetical protein